MKRMHCVGTVLAAAALAACGSTAPGPDEGALGVGRGAGRNPVVTDFQTARIGYSQAVPPDSVLVGSKGEALGAEELAGLDSPAPPDESAPAADGEAPDDTLGDSWLAAVFHSLAHLQETAAPAAAAAPPAPAATAPPAPEPANPEEAAPEASQPAEADSAGPPPPPAELESVLACIRAHESNGNYRATNGIYRGAYQFDQQTWESVGGTGDPVDASPAEQDHRAALLYQSRGGQPWPNARC